MEGTGYVSLDPKPATRNPRENTVPSRILATMDAFAIATVSAFAIRKTSLEMENYLIAFACLRLMTCIILECCGSYWAKSMFVVVSIATLITFILNWQEFLSLGESSVAAVIHFWTLISPFVLWVVLYQPCYSSYPPSSRGSTAPKSNEFPQEIDEPPFRLDEEPLLATSSENVISDAVLARGGPSPEDSAGIVSRLTFWWAISMLKAALSKGQLDGQDLPNLPESDRPKHLNRRFNAWARQHMLSRTPGSGMSHVAFLVAILCRIQPKVFLTCLGFGYTFLGCMFADPLLLNKLLVSTNEGGAQVQSSLLYVLILSASMMLRVVSMEMCYFFSVRTMNNARSALVQAIYQKTFRIKSSVSDDGTLTNLMATDADKLGKAEYLGWFVACWTWAIVSLPGTIYFLWRLVGSAAFIGAATLVVGSLITRNLGRLTQPYVKSMQEERDKRSAVLSELLRSARASKLEGEDCLPPRNRFSRYNSSNSFTQAGKPLGTVASELLVFLR